MPVQKQLILLHNGDWDLNSFQVAQLVMAESRTLATLRDTLLPKLLSGEFTLPMFKGLKQTKNHQ